MHSPLNSKHSFITALLACIFLFSDLQASVQGIRLSLTNSHDVYDETVIAFRTGATDTLDVQHDYPKQRGTADVLLFSKMDTSALFMQTMAPLTDDKTLTLGIDALISGMYRLRLERTDSMDESSVIVLEDIVNGTFQNLRKDRDYWFHLDSCIGAERFRLYCYPAIGVVAQNGKCDGTESMLQISQPGSYQWDYEIKDDNNSVIDADMAWNGSRALMEIPTGAYTISLTDAYGYSIEKQAIIEDKESVVARFQISDSVAPVNQPVYFFDYSVGASDYIWDFGDGEILMGTPFPQKAFTTPGIYRIRFTAANNECNDVSEKVIEVVDPPTGISGISGNPPSIYAAGKDVYFDFTKNLGIARVEIFNLSGQVIHRQSLPAPGKHIVSLSDCHGFVLVKAMINGKPFNAKVLLQ